MREKIEYGTIAQVMYGTGMKVFVIIVILVYMYGALSLKFVSGAESLEQAVSVIIYKDKCEWEKKWYG